MELHYNIIVKGKVQGVYYRANAQVKANELKLSGYVRNLHNGDVLIEAEGHPENLSRFIDWCYLGSPRSKVSEVISEEGDLRGFKTFEVKK